MMECTVKGTVKWFSVEKGFGFILVDGRPVDLYFHVSDYLSKEILQSGDQVFLEIGKGRKSQDAGKSVTFVGRGSLIKNEMMNQKPYYGKPTFKEDKQSYAKGIVWGAVIGGALGPIGAIVGAVVGAVRPIPEPEEITSTCLRCGAVGHVTAIGEDRIGFQCENCRSFWSKRN